MSIGKENKKFKPIIFVLLFLTVILAMSAASAADDDATGDAVIAQTSDYDIEEVSAPSEEVAADTEQAPIYSVDDATVTEEDASADINTNTSSDAADVADTDSGAKNVLAADSGSDNLGVGEQDIGEIDFTYPPLYGGDVCDFTVDLGAVDAQGTVTVTIIDTCVPEDENPKTFVYVMPVNSGVATASQATSITVNGETASYEDVKLWPDYRNEWENGHLKFPDKVTIAYSGDDTYAAKTIETTMDVYPFEASMSIDGAKIGESYDYGEALGLVNFEVLDPFNFNNPILDGEFLVVIVPNTVDAETFDPNRDQDKIVKSAYVHIIGGEGSITFDDIFDEGGYLIGIFYDPVNFIKYSVWEGFQVVNSEVGPFVVSSNGKAYATLEAALAVATEGDTITVIKEGTYTGAANTGLTIAKSVTIAAAGELEVTFDCENNNNFITVPTGKTVSLKDLIIKNGKAEKGGAVYVENGAMLNVDDVEFSYNVANTRGGAIYSEGRVGIIKGKFYKNDITTRNANVDNGGAAIYNYGGVLYVYDSAFDENLLNYVPRTADGPGDLINGVVMSSGTTSIFNSRFYKNSGCYGAAITVLPLDGSTPSLLVNNCQFSKNVAYDGAAMHIEKVSEDFTIKDCTFDGNVASGVGSSGYTAAGGAIFINKCTGKGTIQESEFVKNTAPLGGAIDIDDSKVDIINCAFTENTVDTNGIVSSTNSDLTITSSNFTDNTAGNYGGAVYVVGTSNTNIKDSEFTGNKAVAGSAIIDFSSGDLSIDSCILTENEGTSLGAIYVHSFANSFSIKDSIFADNTAPSYRNIYTHVVPATLSGNIFDSNETTIKVNDISYGEDEVINGTFDSGTNLAFNTPTATITINGEETTASVPTRNTFTKTVEKPNAGTYTATLNKIVDSDNNKILVDNVAGVYNVAKAAADVKVENVEVTYPQTASVTVTSNVSGTYTIRVGNKDYDVVVGEDGSGSVAIDLLEPGVYEIDISADFGPNYETISEIPIATYTVKDQTGPFVVKSNGLGYATLAEALAVANAAGDTITVVQGGTYSGAGNVGVTISQNVKINAEPADGLDVIFDANGADTQILTIANGADVAIKGIDFTGVDNTATKFGAVVNHGTLTIEECDFYDNIVNVAPAAGNNGAAAIFNDADAQGLTISDSSFERNLAKPINPTEKLNTGGIAAVSSWSSTPVSIVGCTFEENEARFGGALEFENLNQVEPCVEDCTFINNHAYVGAAINFNDGCKYEVVTDCDFINNTIVGPQGAPTTGSMGAAICAGSRFADSVLVVTDSNFIGNKGDNSDGSSGGAIRLADKASATITNCEFVDNAARLGSAISAGTLNLDEATVVITACNFTDNTATLAGTLDLGEGITTTIVDSIFSGNVAPANRNIYNEGIISTMTGNTFDINSTDIKVNDIPYTQDEVINGTFDAGVNVDLTGATVSLSIGGEAVTATVAEGNTFTTTLTKPDVGTYDVVFEKVTDADNNVYLVKGPVAKTFKVFKAVADVTVTAETVTYPAQATVVVTSNVTGTYNIRVGNKNYTVTVDETGSGSVEIDQLPAGTYDIDLSADFGDNYEPIVLIPAAQLTVKGQTGPFVVSSNGLGYATLVEALAVAEEFDTITVVEAGVYTGEGNIGVTIDKNIVLAAQEGLDVVFDAKGADTNILTIANGKGVALYDLDFTGVDNTATKFGAVVNHGTLTVTLSKFYDNIVRVDGASGSNGAAAIFNAPDAKGLLIEDSTFLRNIATPKNPTEHINTGGIAAVASWSGNGILKIKNSLFEGNDARFGGAIEIESLNQEEACVDGCTFKDNDGYTGAAININDGTTLATIVNSTFTGNSVRGPQGAPTTGAMGGAISVGYNVPVTVNIDNCNFTGNKDDGTEGSSGGAIRLANMASGVITNCHFNDNVGRYGSAISAGTLNEDAATLVVDKCSFIGNNATVAGTIHTSPGIALTVTGSFLSGNDAPESRNIDNGGTITEISNNVFDVNETTLEVNDIPYTQDEVINGTVDAGVNFDLTGATVKLSINGVEVTAPVNLNAFTYTVTKPDVGTYEVNVYNVVDSEGNSYVCIPTKTDTFVVSKINPTIVFEGDEVTYGETGKVKILTDVPGFYNVTVNGYSVIVNITEEAVIEIPVMDAGKYDVEIFVGESENYNAIAAVAPEGYIVNKATPVVEITGCTVQYPEAGTVTIKTDVGGTYRIVVKGVEAEVVVTETTGQATFVTMPAGQYDINVTFDGNNNYAAGEWIAENAYVVTPGFGNITIEVPQLVYGQEGQGSLKLVDADGQPIAGTVKVLIDETLYEVQTNEQGIGTFEIPNLHVGSHDIGALYVNQETGEGAAGSATLIISPAHSQIVAEDIYAEYGEDVELNMSLKTEVNDKLWGIVAVNLDNKESTTVFVDGDGGSVVFSELSAGIHTVILKYAGNEDIIGSEKVISIVVNKALPVVNVSAEDIYLGDTAHININLTGVDGEKLDGIVNLTLTDDDGVIAFSIYVAVVDGTSSVAVADLDVGKYNIMAVALETENYAPFYGIGSFNVLKTEIGFIFVDADDIKFGEEAIANVELYDVYGDGITGKVIVKVDGRDFPVQVVDGQGSVAIPGIPAGKHNIIVVFPDDGRYGEAYNYSSYLTVSKADNATVTIKTEDVPYGESVFITVSVIGVDGNAMDGIVKVVINNAAYNVAVVDGSGTLEVPGLDKGTYDIMAQFLGDDNYEVSDEAFSEVTVYEALTFLSIDIDDITYGEDAILHIYLEDESSNTVSGEVTITINDVDYVVTTHEDGTAVLVLPNLPVDTYDYNATYPGSSGYAGAKDDGSFAVNPSDDIIVDVTVSEPKYGEDATLTIDVYDSEDNPIDGTATIEIAGREPITVEVVNGKAVVPISDLPAGTTVADIKVINDNYEPQEVIAVITVSKSDKAIVTIVGDEIELGEEATILVTVKDGETGIAGVVVVTVNNVDYAVYTNDEGAGILEIANLPAGEYAIAATFQSTDDYEAVGYTGDAKVVVNLPKNITFDLAYDEENNAINVTNAADLAGEPISGYIFGELFKDGVKVKDLDMGMLDDGTGTIALPDDLAPGDYVVLITAIDEDMEYTGTNEIPVTIEPKSGVQVSASVEDYPFSEAGKLVITVTDIDGNPLDGKIYVEVDGEPYLLGGTVIDGKAEIVLNDLNVGEHVVVVTFDNPNYLTAEATEHFNVTKITTVLVISGSTVEYGEPSTVDIQVTDDNGNPVTGTVIVNVNWEAEGLFDVVELDEEGKGQASFRLDYYVPEGTYNVNATYLGSDIYKENTDETTVTITPSTELNVEISVNSPTSDEDVIFNVSATDGRGAEVPLDKVNVTVNGETKEYPVDENGQVNIGKLPAGENNVTISVDDGFHNPVEINETVVVSDPALIDTIIAVSSTNISYGDKAVINFAFTDAEGNLLSGTLNVTVGDQEMTVDVVDGVGTIELTGLNADTYPVVAEFYGNKTHAASTGTDYFNVAKNATKILYEDMQTIAVDYYNDGRVGEYFKWRLIDANGNPMANVPMQIGFNGIIYDQKDGIVTDEDGWAQLQINLMKIDLYTFAICWLGDENYNGSFVVARITVDPQTPTITVPNKSYKATASTKTLTATFKSNKGTLIPNKKVTFTVNGKTYSAKTDENGVAKVNVKLTTKGTYTVTAKFAGDSTYGAVTKTATLKLT